jgi:hypothetical protein
MRAGFGYKIVQQNITEAISAGLPNSLAVKDSYALARRSFFRKHPGGALPQWLAWPKRYRMREHYDASGRPKFSGAMLENPRLPQAEIAEAARRYEGFAERPATQVKRYEVKLPKAGLAFGRLIQIGYISEYDGKPYRHTFEKARSRPLLVASHDGKSVVIVGGRYAFTDRGIEDR